MKKNFILFALMVFLPVLAFAQSVTLNITGATTVTYNGQDQKPTYRASNDNGNYSTWNVQWRDAVYKYKFNGGEAQDLTASTEFVNAGTYEIIVTTEYQTRANWRDDWTDRWETVTDSKEFTIKPKNFVTSVNCSISPVVFQYTRDECKPTADVVDSELGQLVEGTDFKVDYEDNIEPGTASAFITGMGNYTNDSKTIKFTILANNPGEVISEKDFSTASITLVSPVEYNGTATAAQITSVMLDNVSQVFGNDYKIVGYVEEEAYEDYLDDVEASPNATVALPTILAAPNHVNGWYVLIASAQGGNNPAKWGAKLFNVTARALKIDLLEIHKTYGAADPTLTMANINTWASVNWAPGDGPTNTTISTIAFDRKTLGEDAYDAEGNQLSYGYSLKDPSKLKAVTTINDVDYENYTVGVGQSSNLLIDKAELTITVAKNSKTYGEADPDFKKDAIYSIQKDAEGNLMANTVVITREEGEDVKEGGYAFKADEATLCNFDVTFEPAVFTINAKDIADFTVTFSELTYNGLTQQPVVTVKDGETTLKANDDFTLSNWLNNVNASVDGASVTITGKGNYTGSITKKFGIKKAAGKLVIGTGSKQWGTSDPNPLATVTLVGVNNEDMAAAGIAQPALARESGEEVGTYAITFVNKNVTANNYTFDATTGYENGTFTITRGEIIVVAEPKSKDFGAADPELTWKVQTAPAEFDEKLLENAVTVTRPDAGTTAGENIGNHQIVVSGVTTLSDWKVRYVNSTLTINPAKYFIVAADKEKTYGQADPELTLYVATRTGDGTAASPYVYTEVEGVEIPSTVRAYRVNNYWGYDDAGKQEILVQRSTRNGWFQNWQEFENWATGNYIFTGATGTLTIKKLPVTITAEDKSKTYGDPDPALTVTPTQIVTDLYTETLDQTTFTISREKAGTPAGEERGEYAITISKNKEIVNGVVVERDYGYYYNNRNYDITVKPGKLTISEARLKFKADEQGIHYGESIDPYAVTFERGYGLKNGDKVSDVLELAPKYTAAGTYADGFIPSVISDNYLFDVDDDFTNNYLSISPLKEIPLDVAQLETLLKGIDPANTRTALKDVLADHARWSVDVVLPARKMDADEWYAWVLPFAVKPSAFFASDKLGYGALEILDVNKSKDHKVVFSLQVTGEIPANTPFIAKVENGKAAAAVNAIKFAGVTIADNLDYSNNKPATKADGVAFVGQYENTVGFNDSQMYLAKAGDPAEHPHREFWPGGESSKAVPFVSTNACLQFGDNTNLANVRVFIENETGTYTAINGVEVEAAEAAEGWYTITGVKLEGEPTVSGTYIYNGKKVFIQK